MKKRFDEFVEFCIFFTILDFILLFIIKGSIDLVQVGQYRLMKYVLSFVKGIGWTILDITLFECFVAWMENIKKRKSHK